MYSVSASHRAAVNHLAMYRDWFFERVHIGSRIVYCRICALSGEFGNLKREILNP